MIITFLPKPNFEPMRLIEVMQKSKNMRMMGPRKLKIETLLLQSIHDWRT